METLLVASGRALRERLVIGKRIDRQALPGLLLTSGNRDRP
jgi:hypothetical protein